MDAAPWWASKGDESGDYQSLPAPPVVVNPVVPEAEVLAWEEALEVPPVVVDLGEVRAPEERSPATPRSPRFEGERRPDCRSRCCLPCAVAGTCLTGCCACLVVLGAVVFACVYGILNAPNLNVKANLVVAAGGTLHANLHNTNPYRVTIASIDALVWLKAGDKRPLATFRSRGSVPTPAFF